MVRKVSVLAALVLLLLALSAGSVLAAPAPTETADPCEKDHATMSTEMMIADIEKWTAELPAGVRAGIMGIVQQLSPEKLMVVHHAFCHTELLKQSPSQILSTVARLAR